MSSRFMAISHHEFLQLSKLLEDQCGIYVEIDKSYLFETRLKNFACEHGCRSFTEFLEKVREPSTQCLPELIDLMTTNETFWFRDPTVWECLEQKILPGFIDLLSSRKRIFLYVWSAGSSTGQEAYSLSILLHEVAKKLGYPELTARIKILGTDLSPSVLKTAREGIYDSRALGRGLSLERLNRCFEPIDEKNWRIKPEYRVGLEFRQLNFMDSLTNLGTFDLILCRNVLIYFTDDCKRTLLDKLANQLLEGGLYFAGASEAISRFSNRFHQREFKKSVYYERINSKT
jgi:chemotaxis protein methyltransferase CheR